MTGDKHALDLRRSFADLEYFRVSVEPSDGKLVHEAVTAEYLGGISRVIHGCVRGHELGHSGFLLEGLTRDHPGRGGIVEGAGRACYRLHVGDLELDSLVMPDRPAERLALRHIAQALVHASLR